LVVLALTAVLYLWDLGASGWANSFYAAAVQAGTKSWKAFFFGSFDSSNFITVDKPPAALWVMEVSARIFGLSSWSMLAPQALEGVGAVAVLYAAVRRWSSAGAGLIAAGVMALTPVAALMFRFNNPDALLVLLLCAAAYATTVATEKASTRWLMLAFAFVGLGFTAKMLQAFLVVPAMAATYLLAAPSPFWRRVRQLAMGGVALVVSAGWWVVAVMAVPAADRPYIGGSQSNSLWNLIFGYNGFGRLTGNESGSVGGGAVGTSGRWGATGLTRLFGTEMGSQISWLLPAALVLLVAALLLTVRTARTSRERAAMVLWGGWLVVTGLVFSLSQGIIHPYYNVALAPAIGAVVGIATWMLWCRRSSLWARLAMASTVLVSSIWAVVLLDRTPAWAPALRPVVLALGTTASVLLVVWHRPARKFVARAAQAGVVALAGTAVLAGPASYTLATAATPHSGSIPTAGPAEAAGAFPGGGRAGPGGRGAGPTGAFSGTGGGFGPGAGGGFGPGAGGGFGPGAGGGFAQGGTAPASGHGITGRGITGRGSGPGGGSPFGFFGRPGDGAGGVGGLLNASTPSAAITRALEDGAGKYSWVAAVVGANDAAGYELASGEPVMAIGGFNGTDPAPSRSEFEKYVKEKKIHYFIASGSFGPGAGGAGSADGAADDASLITSWVESNFTATTVGGVTVYNLSGGTPSGSGGRA
jgi:4-amino-4-deoxy-L-arabinose transferase-like glycosyltransferase